MLSEQSAINLLFFLVCVASKEKPELLLKPFFECNITCNYMVLIGAQQLTSYHANMIL